MDGLKEVIVMFFLYFLWPLFYLGSMMLGGLFVLFNSKKCLYLDWCW